MKHLSASKCFSFLTTSLAFVTCILIFVYISELSKFPHRDTTFHHLIDTRTEELVEYSSYEELTSPPANVSEVGEVRRSMPEKSGDETAEFGLLLEAEGAHVDGERAAAGGIENSIKVNVEGNYTNGYDISGNYANGNDVFHGGEVFLEDYKEMNKTLKIFIYPHQPNDPFANILLPDPYEPGGNYASESYFKKALFSSHFITKNPLEADLFYLPFSIASLRNDRRIGVHGIKDFIKDYIYNITQNYPFWNKTGGADHFYVACHSVGRTAMEKAIQVQLNAIQVVCSSSYFLTTYIAHKDAAIPQIWPRKGKGNNRDPSRRETLAFYAGSMNSRERKYLVEVWGNDSDVSVHRNRLKTPYSEALKGSKYCIHAKGYEVNTARIGDAIYYGCVPVILADYYDLPFGDILDWNKFSVVVPAMDIPLLKKILKEDIKYDEYLRMQENVVKVQKHFQWHTVPEDLDAFYMVMYQLWTRKSHLKIAGL